MKTGRYLEGQRNRQAILDHVNQNPGAYGPEILAALGVDAVTGAGRLQRMTHAGELQRVKSVYISTNCEGFTYKAPSYRYWALVKETRSQQDVAKTIYLNIKRQKQEKQPEPLDKNAQRWIGGSFKNTRSDRPAVPCPDAMKGVGYRGMTYLEAMA